TLSIREDIYFILREAQGFQMTKASRLGGFRKAKGADLTLAFEHECTGNHVMQRLLALSECCHDVTDEQNEAGDDLSNPTQRRSAWINATAMQIGDYDSHCLLSNGCLFRRAEEIDFVRDAQSQPDQTTNNGAQHHSYNCRRNGENYSVDKHCK